MLYRIMCKVCDKVLTGALGRHKRCPWTHAHPATSTKMSAQFDLPEASIVALVELLPEQGVALPELQLTGSPIGADDNPHRWCYE